MNILDDANNTAFDYEVCSSLNYIPALTNHTRFANDIFKSINIYTNQVKSLKINNVSEHEADHHITFTSGDPLGILMQQRKKFWQQIMICSGFKSPCQQNIKSSEMSIRITTSNYQQPISNSQLSSSNQTRTFSTYETWNRRHSCRCVDHLDST